MPKLTVLVSALAVIFFAVPAFARAPGVCEIQIQNILKKIAKHGGAPVVSYEKEPYTSAYTDEYTYWCGEWRVRAVLQNGVTCDANGYISECH